MSIVLPKSDIKAGYLFYIAIIVCIVFSILLFVSIVSFRDVLDVVIKKREIGWWIYLIPACVLFFGLSQSAVFWNNRHKRFKKITTGRIIKPSSTGVFQIGAGWLGFIQTGLVGGFFLGQLIQSVYYLKGIRKSLTLKFKDLSFKKMKSVAFEFKDVFIFNSLNSLLNTFSNQLPVILFFIYFDKTIAGLYGMALRIIATPMNLISNSVSEVFYSEASRKVHEHGEGLRTLYNKMLKQLFLIGILPFAILFVFSPAIFNVFLGNEYEMSGLYVRYLIPWLFLSFINIPLSSVITILNKQKIYAIFELSLLVMRFIALFSGYAIYHSPLYSVAFYGMVGFVYNIFLTGYLYFLVSRYQKKK